MSKIGSVLQELGVSKEKQPAEKTVQAVRLNAV